MNTHPDSTPTSPPLRQSAEPSDDGWAAHLNHILEHTNEVLSLHCLNSRFLMVNKGAEAILGYPVDSLRGRLLKTLVHTDDQALLDEFFMSLRSASGPRTAEYRLLHAKGHWIWVETVGRWIDVTAEGEEPCISLVTRDASHKKRAVDALTHSEALAATDDVFCRLRHDFNNNAATAMAGLASLQSALGVPSSTREQMRRAQVALKRSSESLRTFLANPYAHRRMQEASLGDILSSAMHCVQAELDEHHTRVNEDPAITAPLPCNRERLEYVFICLIQNALDAMRWNAPGTLTIKTLSVSDGFKVHFSDTGHGIPTDYIKEAFAPFSSTRDPEVFGHRCGLGLTRCRIIAQQHNGDLQAYANPDGGMTFSLHLPLLSSPASTDQLDKGMELKGKRVVVVDDEGDIRDFLTAVLMTQDCIVTPFATCTQALKYLENQSADLLVTDLVMPDMNGLRMIELLRQRDGASAPPVIVLSGRVHTAQYFNEQNLGVSEVLSKPLSIPALLAACRDAVR